MSLGSVQSVGLARVPLDTPSVDVGTQSQKKGRPLLLMMSSVMAVGLA